ncbi:MAG TPA: TetR/AcrR family transcriptional regulator [Rhizomicrobium sp.]|nr:TetR/AcrR family transcriptional regulator [Rhizomicrobium sp.]
MARTQAADYAERRGKIVDAAAALFAGSGFLGASIADVARACGMSKSLIYHYYASKEDILFDAMHGHVGALLDAANAIVSRHEPAAEKLRALTRAFVRLYAGAADRQRVLLNEMDRLPAAQRRAIVDIQRRLIEIVEDLLSEIRPALSGKAALRTPAAMLYFGMINWMHTWFDPRGRAKSGKIAELAVNLFLDGIRNGEIPA